MRLRTGLASALLLLWPELSLARTACDDPRLSLGDVDCLIASFQKADRALNLDFSSLDAKLTPPRREALQADEVAWLALRDRTCDLNQGQALYIELTCSAKITEAHDDFLKSRIRACVRSTCSDLDFYNTQDGDLPETGPTISRFPSVARYKGPDAGYIAVYTHDPKGSLYAVGDFFVAGFIRLRGHYEGRIFQPEGYAHQDISADRAFKGLTEALFPGRRGGTWVGGDTGGYVSDPAPVRGPVQ